METSFSLLLLPAATTMFHGSAILAALVVSSAYGQDMNMGCILKNCPLKMTKAMHDPTFLSSSKCEMGCESVYDDDPTPEKLHYQNCTTTCAVTYESDAGAYGGNKLLATGAHFPRVGRLRARPRNFMRRIYHTRNSE